MTALYIIAGIIGYLLIGAVLGGLILRFGGQNWATEAYFTIACWPASVCIAIPFGIIAGCIRLAEKIGGVK